MDAKMSRDKSRSEIASALGACRGAFLWIGVFSAFINVLALSGSLFMMEVYDRVIPSGSLPTLVGLFTLVAILYFFQGLLDLMRTRLLTRIGASLDQFSPEFVSLLADLGVHLHQIWMLWLGSGVIGGIGLGLGYISPVSTLIKWFPDRRGMATGMAIMGFGGGAMIGSPLAAELMKLFSSATSVGACPTPSNVTRRALAPRWVIQWAVSAFIRSDWAPRSSKVGERIVSYKPQSAASPACTICCAVASSAVADMAVKGIAIAGS